MISETQYLSIFVEMFFLTNRKNYCNILAKEKIMIFKILIFISIFLIVKKIIIKIFALEIIEEISKKSF